MSAFYQCNSLENLTFSNNLTQIGHRAFKECENLVTVELPDSVTYIGEEVFARCSKLVSCRLPNNPTLTELEYGTFYFCFGFTIKTFSVRINSNSSHITTISPSTNCHVINSRHYIAHVPPPKTI